MAMWKNDDEMFALMKEKLYTPVVGDILDQMGYKHQFLPASIRPLAAQVPTAPYILPGEEEDRGIPVHPLQVFLLLNAGDPPQHFPEESDGGVPSA